jgi:hypothetical protein
MIKRAIALGVLAVAANVGAAWAEPGWVELFNGKDLTGWERKGGKGEYRVEDGAIVGRSVAHTPNTFLCTTREYGDFELEFEFKLASTLNSGVQIRSAVAAEAKTVVAGGKEFKVDAGRMHGYQSEMDPTNRGWTCGIYEEGLRGWLDPVRGSERAKAFGEAGMRLFKPTEWNKVRIVCSGDSIKTWLNGEARADLKDDRSLRGVIGLQVHSVPKPEEAGSEVSWRNLRIRELTPAKP